MSATRKNRLALEASPYLLQHARNPVDWYPWGPAALARAKAEDKPILLSIGYSACHWCHVMERESFEDEAIARLMNEHFVCIKVDREERPDLDQIYQLAVQIMGQSGGWPLTVFLTPEQKPFFGGTYFPPVDRRGMPGFPKVLRALAEAYADKREDVAAQADELTAALARVSAVQKQKKDAVTLGPEVLARAVEMLSRRFDDERGGFGTRPKFPNTMSLDVLLRRGALDGDPRAKARMVLALDAMRGGGIYDQLGGGFHRYSTDEKWLVPHFEKMLYDNALLLRLYVDAWRATGEARFASTAREIATYVLREMTAPEGGFYATQDADSEGEDGAEEGGEEGRFFVWTPEELASVLDAEEARVAQMVFGVTDEGNFERSGATVLSIAKPPSELGAEQREVLTRATEKMRIARERRVKPMRDEKILASWNGLMIGALADAGAALGEQAMLAAAERAFAFVWSTLVTHGGDGAPIVVQRHVMNGVVKGPGFLDDYAMLARAALDLYEATARPEYADRAELLGDAIVARFWDGADDAFFFTPDGGEPLVHRAKDPYDHAVPSGASVALEVMARLGALRDARFEAYAARGIARLAPAAMENPFGMSQTILLVDRLVRGSVDVVIAGPAASDAARALAREVFTAFLPNRNVAYEAGAPLLAGGKSARDVPLAYVCRGQTCSMPVSTPDALRALLRR